MPANQEAMDVVGDYKSGWHDPENSTIRFDFGLSERWFGIFRHSRTSPSG